MPAISATMATAIAVCTPSRRASGGASGASRPKHSTGSVASAPAHPEDRPVSDWMRSSTGPMLAAAGRRLMATRITPPASRAGESGGRPERCASTPSTYPYFA